MHYTRIFADDNGDSHFEVVYVPLVDKGIMGSLSMPFETNALIFRENKADYDWDFHNAPTRQFIILLDGEIKITTSLGVVRRFRGGEILLVEDTAGAGHKTENILQSIRKSLFITL
ncbi:hypothetical protein QWZ08_10615 [Ferruginibacter paludis]|uniref:hypothetical protein n=1 Tax=Ferruginibacter paludis TaxID=1310417 RepID=UPI0025B398E5|nr:hypothetical protein [Ferruginibacter paludis]MDN3656080.1 hypothetical protein [Ferruginibacter paludis]